MSQRMDMFGLAVEICSENGFIWNRRHLMVRDFATSPTQPPEIREKFEFLGKKYWYSQEAAAAAPKRCAEIMRAVSQRLHKQKAAGSPYLIGSRLTAVDIYWACSVALLRPLPDELCEMPPLFREVYYNTDPVLNDALDPILTEHRDFIYHTYLELPVRL